MECAWTSSLQGSPPRRQTTARLHFRWDIWQHSPAIAPISRHCADLSARSLRQFIPISTIEPAPTEQQLLFYPLLEPCSESPKRSGTVYAML